jgi:hypothetical protein
VRRSKSSNMSMRKLSLKSKMRHQISRDVLRLGGRTVCIVVTADKLKTRKRYRQTFIGHVRRGVHSYRMMAGLASGVYSTRWVYCFRRGSSERDRQRHQGREIQWPDCRSRDEALYFDKVV